jgi:hypothetical protein
MVDLHRQLLSIRNGKSKRIKGCDICRDGSNFIIDGDVFSTEDALIKLDELSHKPTGVDYSCTAFFEKPSYADGYGINFLKIFRFKNKSEHLLAVEEVRKRKNRLWYGKVVNNDGRYSVKQPLLIDFDTVSDELLIPPKPLVSSVAESDGGLTCPFCNMIVSSKSGRTLHVKYQHGDRLHEYRELVK